VAKAYLCWPRRTAKRNIASDGPIGKARGHRAIGGRQPARDHGVLFGLCLSADPIEDAGPWRLGNVTNGPFTTGVPAFFRRGPPSDQPQQQTYRSLRNIQQHRPKSATFFDFRWSHLHAISSPCKPSPLHLLLRCQLSLSLLLRTG
jgi:hypothetical protein